MSMTPLRFALLALLLLPVAAQAHNRGWFPRAVGECGWVYGRYAIYNGSGVRRIWVIGTTHMLNLRDSDDNVPQILEDRADRLIGDQVAYGQFYACALERFRRGHMQQIRIQRVRNLIIREPL